MTQLLSTRFDTRIVSSICCVLLLYRKVLPESWHQLCDCFYKSSLISMIFGRLVLKWHVIMQPKFCEYPSLCDKDNKEITLFLDIHTTFCSIHLHRTTRTTNKYRRQLHEYLILIITLLAQQQLARWLCIKQSLNKFMTWFSQWFVNCLQWWT